MKCNEPFGNDEWCMSSSMYEKPNQIWLIQNERPVTFVVFGSWRRLSKWNALFVHLTQLCKVVGCLSLIGWRKFLALWCSILSFLLFFFPGMLCIAIGLKWGTRENSVNCNTTFTSLEMVPFMSSSWVQVFPFLFTISTKAKDPWNQERGRER